MVRLKLFTSLIFFGVLFQACSHEEELTTDAAPETPMDSAHTDLPEFELNLVPASIELKDISGKVFHFGPFIDTTICEAYGDCDCCTDDFLFLDDNRFIVTSYCVADQYIRKGTYTVEEHSVTLQYDSVAINRMYDWEMEDAGAGTGESLYAVEIESAPTVSATFTSWQCGDGFLLKLDKEEIYYGTRDLQTTLKTEIDFMRIDGTWELIEW